MKTQKSFKKRALLSSIAMLLVATVAVGSATFAWFAANPKANASGLSLKTTAATGLVVRTDSDDVWSHEAALYKGQKTGFDLQPVSQEQETPANFWKITAKDSSKPDYDTDATMTTAKLGTYNVPGDVYKEKVYFRLSDGSAATTDNVYLTGVTITKNEKATMENAIRVAIVDKDDNLLGTYAIASGGANGTLTTSSKTAGAFDPALATSVPSAGIKVADGSNLTAKADDLDQYVTVYVYLDGQDNDCYSDKVGTVNAAEIISSVQVDFQLKPTTATT